MNTKKPHLYSFRWIFICLLIISITGCKKQAENIQEETNNQFFTRRLTENNGMIKSNGFDVSSGNNDFIDSIISALKIQDKKFKFSNKVLSDFGTPKWDYFMQLNNSNGNKTIIIPILNGKSKKVDLLLFLYGEAKSKYKVKFVVRKSKQLKLKKHGDKAGKEFTEQTLNGLFDVLEKNIANSGNENKTEVIKNKSNGVYVHVNCWYYTWSDGMSMGISNTQCSYTIVLTPEAYNSLDGGGSWGLPEMDLNVGGGGGGEPSNPELTEEQKLEVLLNCNCNCPEDDVMVSFESSIEPKWGQLGSSRSLNAELTKLGVDASSFTNLSFKDKLSSLKDYFDAHRSYTYNGSSYADQDGSKKIDRYFYTFDRGWIDIHHMFYTAYLAEKFGGITTMVGLTVAEFYQLFKNDNYSGFAYEDAASNMAGIEFYIMYKDALKSGNMSIRDAINDYFGLRRITEPQNAPNYHLIPHVLDRYVPKTIFADGLKGDELFKAAYEAYCKKSKVTKDNIRRAHQLIHHSANN
jgi:hypothetical protein